METVLMVVQFFIVIALVFAILLQKSGNDGLAGLAGGGHNVLSGKSAANAFTKATMLLAAALMVNSLLLARIHESQSGQAHNLLSSMLEDNGDQQDSIEEQIAGGTSVPKAE